MTEMNTNDIAKSSKASDHRTSEYTVPIISLPMPHGQHARKGGRGSEQAVGHLRRVANNHLNGKRLAERASHTQHDCGAQRGHGRTQHHMPNGLPSTRAYAIGAFTVGLRHSRERVDGKRRNRGKNHHSEHN